MGNGTFEGDVTMEIDQSLLLDDVNGNVDDNIGEDEGLDDEQNSILVQGDEDDLQAEQYPYDADDSLLRDHSYLEDLQEADEQQKEQSLTKHKEISQAPPLRVENENESKSAPAHVLRKQTI